MNVSHSHVHGRGRSAIFVMWKGVGNSTWPFSKLRNATLMPSFYHLESRQWWPQSTKTLQTKRGNLRIKVFSRAIYYKSLQKTCSNDVTEIFLKNHEHNCGWTNLKWNNHKSFVRKFRIQNAFSSAPVMCVWHLLSHGCGERHYWISDLPVLICWTNTKDTYPSWRGP